MCRACLHVARMGKMVQIRNMPEKMHRILKSRAAQEGMSLSAYLLRELKKTAGRPTEAELRERLSRRQRFDVDAPALIQEARDERDGQIDEWLKDVRR